MLDLTRIKHDDLKALRAMYDDPRSNAADRLDALLRAVLDAELVQRDAAAR